jgi:hypothetical protein
VLNITRFLRKTKDTSVLIYYSVTTSKVLLQKMANLEKSNSEEKSKGFEKIFDIVGGHGPFQWALVAVLSLLVYFNLC